MRQVVFIMFKVIIALRFTFRERKTWQNIDKSQNIMELIVGFAAYNSFPDVR